MARITLASQALIIANLTARLDAMDAAKVTAPTGAEFVAARRDARIVRRETTPLGGLLKAERKALAAAHRKELAAARKVSAEAYSALWLRLVTVAKAAK